MKKSVGKKNYKRKSYRKKFYTGTQTTPSHDTALVLMNKIRPRVMAFKRSLLTQSLFSQPVNGLLDNSATSALTYSLNSFPSTIDMAGLFSQYRIASMTVTIRLTDCPELATQYPTLYLWKNNDFPSTSFSLSQVGQIPNVKKYTFSPDHRQVSLTIIPYNIGNVFNGGFDVLYKKWMSFAYNTVPYYGFGYYVENIVGASVSILNMELDVQATILCKSQF